MFTASDTSWPSTPTIFFKEVFGPLYPQENYDPVDWLLRKGVPAEKICWLVVGRTPGASYATWKNFTFRTRPEVYAAAQAHSFALYHRYKDLGVRVVPLVYDDLQGQELPLLQRVLALANPKLHLVDLTFDMRAILDRLVPCEAGSQDYFDQVLRRLIDSGKFSYHPTRSHEALVAMLGKTWGLNDAGRDTVEAELRAVDEICRPGFERFYDLAARELGL